MTLVTIAELRRVAARLEDAALQLWSDAMTIRAQIGDRSRFDPSFPGAAGALPTTRGPSSLGELGTTETPPEARRGENEDAPPRVDFEVTR